MVEGIGEKVTVLPPLPRRCLLLVNPGFPVSTREIFAAFDDMPAVHDKDSSILMGKAHLGDWDRLEAYLYNDLQAVAFHVYPNLKKISAWFLSEGLMPLMSGSGPSVYAFVSDIKEAKKIAANMPGELGRIWVLSTVEKGVYHEREIIAGEAGTIPASTASGI